MLRRTIKEWISISVKIWMQFRYFQLILFFPDKICPESDPRTSCLNWQRGLDLQNKKIYWNLILTCELLLLFSAI